MILNNTIVEQISYLIIVKEYKKRHSFFEIYKVPDEPYIFFLIYEIYDITVNKFFFKTTVIFKIIIDVTKMRNLLISNFFLNMVSTISL